jgi:4-amino-4-deoxy-L-arabinose transferase-like glycosyltransferase
VSKRSVVPALIVLLALALRLVAIAADSGYVPAHDAYDYDRHARSIASGEGFPESGYVPEGGPSALRPPVYPYLLGAVYAASGDSITMGRVVGALFGALAVALLYLIVLRIWGRRVGLIAALLAAVFPSLVLLSQDLLSEQLFLALELGAVLCVLEFRGSGGALRWAVAAGLLCGVATLTRNPGGVLVLPIALGVWTQRPHLRLRALGAPLVVLGCVVLTMIPWTVRNWVDFGRFVPVTSSTGFGLAGTYNAVSERDTRHPAAWRTPVIVPEYAPLFQTAGVDEATLDATLRHEAIDFAIDHPAYVAEASGLNLLRLFELRDDSVVGRESVPVVQRGIGSHVTSAERIGLVLAALMAAVGLVALLRRALPRGPAFLWLVPVLTVLVAAPIAGLPRYRVPADPFLLILAAIGVSWLWERALKRSPIYT